MTNLALEYYLVSWHHLNLLVVLNLFSLIVRKSLYLCFCLGLGFYAKCQMFGRDPWTPPLPHVTNHIGNATTSGCRSFSSFFVGLGFGKFRTEFSYSNEDLMILLLLFIYLGFKCGFGVWSFVNLWVFSDLSFVSKWV